MTDHPRRPSIDTLKKSIAPREFYQREFPDTPLQEKGNGWVRNIPCPMPGHEDGTPSFGVNLKNGQFKCFACGVAGSSILDFSMARYGLAMDAARDKLSADYHLSGDTPRATTTPPTATTRRKPNAPPTPPPKPLTAIPAHALATQPAAHPTLGPPDAAWCYSTAAGEPIIFVWRFDPHPPQREKKIILPLTWTPGGGWEFKGLGAKVATPLYQLDHIAAHAASPILVAEGEKAADAAARLLPETVTTATMNGADSPGKADWRPVKGRLVLIWPDADPPGAEYAAKVASLATAAGATQVRILDLACLAIDPATGDPRPLAAGWDAADALADGWDAPALATAARWTEWRPDPGPDPATAPPAPAGATPSAPPGLPSGYEWRANGIFFRHPGEPPEKARYVCPPLRVLAVSHDEQNRDFGRLVEFADINGETQRLVIYDHERSGSGDALRARLARRGFECSTTAECRRLFLDLFRRWQPSARALSVRKTGWIRDHSVFVLGHRIIGAADDAPPVILADDVDRPATGEQGTLAEYQEQVFRLAIGNSRLLFGISSGFAPPLLALIGQESGGINFYSDTSRGKTTLANAIASLFGRPADYRRQWRATSNGLEGAAAAHNDLPLILDDLGQLAPREAGDSAYLLANGQNKQRMTPGAESRPLITWRLIFVSTGELTLAELANQAGIRLKAGQEVRVLELPADAGRGLGIFEELHEAPTGAALAQALNAATTRCYGTAGPAFLGRLVAEREEVAAWGRERIQDFTAQLLAAIPAPPGEVIRAAGRFATIALAGTLATHWGITGWPPAAALDATRRCFAAWLAARGGAVPATERDLLEQVRGFLKRHANRFRWLHRIGDDHAPDIPHAAGYRVKLDPVTREPLKDDGENRYSPAEYLLEFRAHAQVFREEIIAGYDYAAACAILRRHGLIIPGADGRNTRKLRVPGYEHPQRFVVLDLRDHADSDEVRPS